MTLLEQAQAIINSVAGITVTSTVKNAISALDDILTLQKKAVQDAHKAVNAAKEHEDDEKLTYKMIENMQKKATMQRQELRDERYQKPF